MQTGNNKSGDRIGAKRAPYVSLAVEHNPETIFNFKH